VDVTETRSLAFEQAEIRAQGAGSRQRFLFSGYAATFGTLSHELREAGVNRGQPFRERIAGPAAIAETLKQDDIRFVLNHELRQLLGRTSSGTLKLGADERGLSVDAELPDTSYARDYAELVQRGDAGEMSFRFYSPRDTWTHEQGAAIRTLNALRIREVSALTVPPAYPETEASVAIEAARALALAEEELRAGRVLSEENILALKTAHKAIGDVLARAAAIETGDRSASLDLLRRRLALRERGV
jgi:HK97 family phage prohead protease